MSDVSHYMSGFREWAFQDKHKQKARQVRDQLERAFTEHPHAGGETYMQHLWFTLFMTSRLIFSGTVLFFHGVFPFLFTRTASRQVEIIYRIMKMRIPKTRLQEIDTGLNSGTEQ